jgi:hypothetical protein
LLPSHSCLSPRSHARITRSGFSCSFSYSLASRTIVVLLLPCCESDETASGRQRHRGKPGGDHEP